MARFLAISCIFGLLLLALAAVVFVVGPLVQDVARAIDDISPAARTSPREELIEDDILYLSTDHAMERHGEISVTIKSQCEANPTAKATRELDGRLALGCEYEPGKFGVAIYEADGDFVTAFPNRASTLDKLLEYFSNRGYR